MVSFLSRIARGFAFVIFLVSISSPSSISPPSGGFFSWKSSTCLTAGLRPHSPFHIHLPNGLLILDFCRASSASLLPPNHVDIVHPYIHVRTVYGSTVRIRLDVLAHLYGLSFLSDFPC